MFEVVFTGAAGFCASGDGEATKDFVLKKRTPEPLKVDSEQWKPPNSSELKVNVDGSLDEGRSEGSIACLQRLYRQTGGWVCEREFVLPQLGKLKP